MYVDAFRLAADDAGINEFADFNGDGFDALLIGSVNSPPDTGEVGF